MSEPASRSVAELDLLRGLAIVLMVVNHAGYRLLAPVELHGGPLAELVFVGSFAPVVFFFTTGFGLALSRPLGASRAALPSTLLKAALLLLADQFLFWKDGHAAGLDFLGFIAICSLVVNAMLMTRRPVLSSCLLIGMLLVLRFAAGPALRPLLETQPFLAWVVGATAVSSIAYPLSPWIVYPLLGLVAASGYRQLAGPGPVRWSGRIAALALLPLGAAAVLDRAGFAFFRWGFMNFGYFVLSLGVLALAIAIAIAVAHHWQLVARLLSLRGVASFAVVPIHYALLQALASQGAVQLAPVEFLVATALLIAVSMAASRFFAALVGRWISLAPSASAVVYPLAAVVLACIAAIWWPSGTSLNVFVVCIVAQLAIAALLAVRNRRDTSSSAVSPRAAVS